MTVYTVDLEGRLTSTNRSWSQFASENGAPTLAEETMVCGQSLWSSIGDPVYRTQIQRALEVLRTGYVFSTVDITPSHRSREALIDTGLALSRTIDLDRVFYEVGRRNA